MKHITFMILVVLFTVVSSCTHNNKAKESEKDYVWIEFIGNMEYVIHIDLKCKNINKCVMKKRIFEIDDVKNSLFCNVCMDEEDINDIQNYNIRKHDSGSIQIMNKTVVVRKTDKLTQLYDALKADGAGVPDTYEEFKIFMRTSTKNRQQLYDALKADGVDVPGTYDEFAQFIYGKSTDK